jgi:hypothetical protein
MPQNEVWVIWGDRLLRAPLPDRWPTRAVYVPGYPMRKKGLMFATLRNGGQGSIAEAADGDYHDYR